MVEQRNHNPCVVGSSPALAILYSGITDIRLRGCYRVNCKIR